jgi:hypothetical protein
MTISGLLRGMGSPSELQADEVARTDLSDEERVALLIQDHARGRSPFIHSHQRSIRTDIFSCSTAFCGPSNLRQGQAGR